MPEDMQDLADAEPFKIVKGADETDGEFVRFEATLHPSSDEVEADSDLPHRRWAADDVHEHIHPTQEERLRVLSGRYQVVIAGNEHTLTEGEEITLPANTSHRHWNPTDQPVRVVNELQPARDAEVFFSTLFALAQAGETDEEGLPNILQFAVLQDAYPNHAYITGVPIPVQKGLFMLLAPFGRLLGYEAAPPPEEATGH